MKFFIVIVIILLGVWYVILPVSQPAMLSSLPNSVKVSQSEYISKYYTNNRRNFVTDFYKNELERLNCQLFKYVNPFCLIKPLSINHSPNLASTYLDPKQKSTYLEEYFYILRDSLIISGYEPFNENGKAFDKNSEPLVFDGKQYNSEVTIRYYPSSTFGRVVIYLLILTCIYFEVILFKRTRRKHE